MNDAWETLKPKVQATLQETSTFDAGEIKLIPADATCGNACQHAASCGNIGSCKIDVCHDVIAQGACNTVCPGGSFNPLCRLVCPEITKRICGKEDDQSCITRINACTSGAAECLARWTSGLQATCEATLATLRGAGFTGLAEVSGGMSVTGDGETANTSGLTVAPDLGAVELGITVAARANVDAHVDVVFTDFGNFFACPSGRLSANPSFSASLADQKLSARIVWNGGNATPLVAHISPNDPTIVIKTAEPPIVTMVKNNPGLLLCGPIQAAIGPIVGLAVIASPHFTRELLSDALRKALPGEKGQMAAAIIDGEYRYTPRMPPIDFVVPSAPLQILDKAFVVAPRMTEKAVELVLQ